MSNTISEGEIVIKDEFPEAEPIKIHEVPAEKIDETKDVIVKIEENELERFEISTLGQEDEAVFTCDSKLTFKTEQHLEDHDLTHTTSPTSSRKLMSDEKHYKLSTCTFCNKVFNQSCDLKRHIKAIHEKAETFECSICNQKFLAKRYLDAHKTQIHLKNKIYECSLCRKKFQSRSYRDCHRRKCIV
jgi:hypothetical protein